MRGKGGSCCSCGRPVGITPAYAGKSWPDCTALYQCRDHPRICREKRDTMAFYPCVVGSPPRMRGKAEPEGLRQLSGGITPAYAGKRGARRNGKSRPQDHPRVCGEKHDLLHVRTCELGSPPRVRGKASISVSSAHNGHQPKAIGLAAPHALTQQCPELFCIGHL